MDPSQNMQNGPLHLLVAADQDRFGEQRGLGVSAITFKVMPKDSQDVFIIENTFHAKGGPARHLHYEQDEWFYIVEGEFTMEIGQDQFELAPGDSILGPRNIPHVLGVHWGTARQDPDCVPACR